METYDFMKKIGESSNRVNDFYFKWCKANGISYNEMAVLYVTLKDKNATQKTISQEWSLPKQTVNSIVKKMKENNLIILEKSENDAREARLALTQKGIDLAVPLVEKLLAVETRILSSLGEEKLSMFLKYFEEFCCVAEKELKNSVRSDKNE